MKRQAGGAVVGILMGLMFSGTVWGQEESRRGEIRGAFARLTEQRVGEQVYMGVVVKPSDNDDHLTLLVPRQNEQIASSARKLKEGQRLEAVWVLEGGHRWITELGARRLGTDRRESDEMQSRGEIERLRARVERLERSLTELHAEMRRLRTELRGSSGVRRAARKTARRDRDEARTEREIVLERVEVMRMALPALREAERGDAADLLRLAIRSREVMLEGRRDEEARSIRERAPNRAQLAEILTLAARLWREFGHAEKSIIVRELAEQLAASERGVVRARSDRPDRRRRAVHVTVRATEAGETEVFFRERRMSMELLQEALHDLDGRQERGLTVHVRGDVREDFVRRITEAAKDVGIKTIEVEHIKRKRGR